MYQVIEQTKLEIGLEGPFHLMPWNEILKYTTQSWILSLFGFVSDHGILLYEKTPCLKPLQDKDISIMQLALSLNLSKNELRRVNNVRQWIQVSFLSEICTLAGDQIRRCFWDGISSVFRVRNDSWPRAAPPREYDFSL